MLCCDILSRLENYEIITSKTMLSDKATYPKATHISQQTFMEAATYIRE